MLKKALQNDKCIAVNTLGFFKDKPSELSPSAYFKEKDGIFIKKNQNLNVGNNNIKILGRYSYEISYIK